MQEKPPEYADSSMPYAHRGRTASQTVAAATVWRPSLRVTDRPDVLQCHDCSVLGA